MSNNLKWKREKVGRFEDCGDRIIFKYENGGGLTDATAILCGANCVYREVEGKKIKMTVILEEIE